eukprot:scaffold543_cov106-Skeletonema_marinoi.AAC.7
MMIAYKRRRRCDVSSGRHGVLFLLLPSTVVMSFTAAHKEAAAWPYGRGPWQMADASPLVNSKSCLLI